MRTHLLHALAALCVLPALASAAEPSKGTVIMVSSIGIYVLLSSGGVMLRERRRARREAAGRPSTDEPKA